MDTKNKNLNVTRNLIRDISGRDPDEILILRDEDKYHKVTMRSTNWRNFYRDEFQLSEEQIEEAGSLWTDYQLSDDTLASLFDGIKEGIKALGNIPQGIVSQNSKSNVIHHLEKEGIMNYFRYVVGYEEVEIDKQKP